jgi:hypothetical protein
MGLTRIGKRRGCALICPEGDLSCMQGKRLVLASTEQLHDRVSPPNTRPSPSVENPLKIPRLPSSNQPCLNLTAKYQHPPIRSSRPISWMVDLPLFHPNSLLRACHTLIPRLRLMAYQPRSGFSLRVFLLWNIDPARARMPIPAWQSRACCSAKILRYREVGKMQNGSERMRRLRLLWVHYSLVQSVTSA